MIERLRQALMNCEMDVQDRRPRPRIHVGPAVADWVREQCTVPDVAAWAISARFFGFDLVEEKDWEPERIVVRTDRVIP